MRGGRSHLAAAIRKYGRASFRMETMLLADWDYLNKIEPKAIVALGTRSPHGYNLREGGSRSSPHEETRKKMRAAKLGKKHSFETREKMSAAHRGRAPSPETLAASRLARIGSKHSDEARAKMSAWQSGRPSASEDSRRNMSAAAVCAWKQRRSKLPTSV